MRALNRIVFALAWSGPSLAAQSSPAAAAIFSNGRVVASERIDEAFGASQIFTYAADGSDRRALTTAGNNVMPSWSRDGQRILFTANRELWVMNATGGERRQLTFATAGGNFTPVESPDGSRIAFTGVRGAEPPEVWVMNADGTGARRLTTTPRLPGQELVWSLHPTWSADGRKIAFASTRSGSTQVWVMTADGSEQTQLTRGLGEGYPDANVPSWSFDGKLIAFWAGYETKFGEVWVMEPDGKNPRPLTDTPDPSNSDDPHWSPDGTKIIFGRGVGGDRAMFVVDVNTRAVTPFATGVHWCDWQPLAAAPAGSRLVNLAARATASAAEPLIAGFVVSGSGARRMLVRAVGPTLTQYGVSGELADPQLQLYRDQTKTGENDDWHRAANAAEIATAATQIGAFPLPSASKDAALLVTLPPGAYTAQALAPAGTSGVVLIEVYDAGDGDDRR